MVKTRSQDGDSKGKELDVEDPMEYRLSRLEDLFAERIKMMKQFADMVKALAGQQLEELQSSNVLLEEKSKPQFQVISDPFTEPLECASNLKVPASVYDMDSHDKEMEEFPHQSTNGSGKKIAHQLFDQMPSKEKQRKCLKAWRFKFKRKNLTRIMLQMEQYKLMERRRRRYKKFSTNIKDESMRVLITGNHRRMVRQLHISRVSCKIRRMKDSWNMRRLTLKVMKSHRKHKWKSKKLQIASNSWPVVDQKMVPMQDNEKVTNTYLGQAHELQDTTGVTSIEQELSYWSVAKHVKRDAHESFGSIGLAYDGCVILGMNFAGCERGKTELLAFLHMNVIDTRYATGERDDMIEVVRDVSKRSMLGLTFGIRESNAGQGQQAEFEQIVMANEWLLQTSFVSQQVMSNTKLKFSKRWWFKYKYVKVNDQKQQGDYGHYSLLVAAANWSSQMHLWSTSYRVWHRWKARDLLSGPMKLLRKQLGKFFLTCSRDSQHLNLEDKVLRRREI